MTKLIYLLIFLFVHSSHSKNIPISTMQKAPNELDKIINSLKESTFKLKETTKNIEESDQNIQVVLKKIQDIDIQNWSLALLNDSSPIKLQDAETKFEKPKNEIEKILSASLLKTKGIIKKDSQNDVSKKATLYMDKEIIPTLQVFVNSLNSKDRTFIVSDNSLAFGNEIETLLLRKEFDDSRCTKEYFNSTFKEMLTKDKKKNMALFLTPYIHYQNKYLPSYIRRLLELSNNYKHERKELVQNALKAFLIQTYNPKLKTMNHQLLENHEKTVRNALNRPDLSSEEIELLEHYIIKKSPECYGNGIIISKKIQQFIFQKE